MLSRSFPTPPISWLPPGVRDSDDNNRLGDIVNAVDKRKGEDRQQASAIWTIHCHMGLRKFNDGPQCPSYLIEKPVAQPRAAMIIPIGSTHEFPPRCREISNFHCSRRRARRFLASAITTSASYDRSSPARYLSQRRSASAAHASLQVSDGSWKLTSNASMSSACSSAESLRASAISCLTCWFMGSQLARSLSIANGPSRNESRQDVEKGRRR